MLTLAACGGPPTPAAPSPSELDPDAVELVRTITGGGDPAASVIDAHWASALPGYESPTAAIGYRAGEIPDTVCGDRDDADSWRDNAFYCPDDAKIVYDLDFLAALYASSGDFAPVSILAHEWGHHVQHQSGPGEFSIQDELMADCFAGAFTSSADEAAALAEQMLTFYELGNEQYEPTTWFGALEHGAPTQRAAAWSMGYTLTGSPELTLGMCAGYADWEPGATVELAGYRFTELPGRPGVVSGATYVVEADGAVPGVGLQTGPAPVQGDAASLAEQLVPVEPGALDVLPIEVDRSDAAALYYSHDGGGHGFLAVIMSTTTRTVLVVIVPGTGSLSSWTNPTAQDETAAFAATNLGLLVVARVCAPGQVAGATESTDDFNASCGEDL